MPEGRLAPRQLKFRENQERALALRVAGLSLSQIASQTEYGTTGAVSNAIHAALRRRVAPDIDAYRAMSMARLERALQAMWPAVLRGEEKILGRFIQLNDQMNNLMGAYPKTPAMALQVAVETADELTTVGISWTPDDEWMRKFAQAWAEVHPEYDPVPQLTNGTEP